MLGCHRDRSLTIVHERQRRPVIARQPHRRGDRPDRQHATAHHVRLGVIAERAYDGRHPVGLRSHIVVSECD